MAQGTIAWDFVERPRAQVPKDTAVTLQAKVYSGGTQLVVTAGTISIKMPGGGALPTPVSGASVTCDGSGTMSYSFSAANAATLGSNYSAVWTPTVGSTTYAPAIQLFDVVRYPLRNPVIPTDLDKYYPDLSSSFATSETSTETYIEEAFLDVWYVLDSKGKRPFLVLSAEDLRRPIENLALARFFLARAKRGDPSDLWFARHKFHESEWQRWLATANFSYDADDSGTIDGTSEYHSEAGEDGKSSGFRWGV